MIDYLRGRLVSVSPGRAVLELGGVALNLETPVSPDGPPLQVGTEVTFYTRLVVKEDSLSLYGFRTAEERTFFGLVIGVSGFGPRLALALLGAFTVSQLYVAVLEENIAMLCRASGVGRKGAQRLVLELKEKLPKYLALEGAADPVMPAANLNPREEVVEALCALGYSPAEALTAVNRVARAESNPGREELLKLALKKMSGG